MAQEKFYVQVIFNGEQLSELLAVRPTPELLESQKEMPEERTNTLIKINKSQILNSAEKELSNRIILPKHYISSEEQPLKKKQKKQKEPNFQNQNDDSFPEDMSEEFEELDMKDLENLDLDLEDDFGDDDLEGLNVSVSSGNDNRKLTKRQLVGKEGNEQFLQLPDKRGKNRKKLILTDDDIQKRNLKDIERKQKLLKQQEEFKQQTVDKILNEVGKKQKQRQEQEEKQSQLKVHKYRELPENDLVIKYISDREGERVVLSPFINTYELYAIPNNILTVKEKLMCSNCGLESKYKVPKSDSQVCSLVCFKVIKQKQ